MSEEDYSSEEELVFEVEEDDVFERYSLLNLDGVVTLREGSTVTYTLDPSNRRIVEIACKNSGVCNFARMWKPYFMAGQSSIDTFEFPFTDFRVTSNKLFNETTAKQVDDDEGRGELLHIVRGRDFLLRDVDVPYALIDFHSWIHDCQSICCLVCGRYTGEHGICDRQICMYNLLQNSSFRDFTDFDVEMYKFFRSLFLCALNGRKEVHPSLPSGMDVAVAKESLTRLKHPNIEDLSVEDQELVWWVYKFPQTRWRFVKVRASDIIPGEENLVVYSVTRIGEEPLQGKTKTAFHGSPCENWISILTNGLLGLSGTKFQVHGAVYGSGVYAAPDFTTSFMGYTRGDLRVVAKCAISAHYMANPYFVIEDAKNISIQYLIVSGLKSSE
jgi:hypothetical protein